MFWLLLLLSSTAAREGQKVLLLSTKVIIVFDSLRLLLLLLRLFVVELEEVDGMRSHDLHIFFYFPLYRTNFARSRTKNNSQLLFSKVILQYLVCVGKSTNNSSTLQKASLRLKSSLTLLQNYESILHNIYIWSSVSGVSECFKGPRVT